MSTEPTLVKKIIRWFFNGDKTDQKKPNVNSIPPFGNSYLYYEMSPVMMSYRNWKLSQLPQVPVRPHKNNRHCYMSPPWYYY